MYNINKTIIISSIVVAALSFAASGVKFSGSLGPEPVEMGNSLDAIMDAIDSADTDYSEEAFQEKQEAIKTELDIYEDNISTTKSYLAGVKNISDKTVKSKYSAAEEAVKDFEKLYEKQREDYEEIINSDISDRKKFEKLEAFPLDELREGDLKRSNTRHEVVDAVEAYEKAQAAKSSSQKSSAASDNKASQPAQENTASGGGEASSGNSGYWLQPVPPPPPDSMSQTAREHSSRSESSNSSSSSYGSNESDEIQEEIHIEWNGESMTISPNSDGEDTWVERSTSETTRSSIYSTRPGIYR